MSIKVIENEELKKFKTLCEKKGVSILCFNAPAVHPLVHIISIEGLVEWANDNDCKISASNISLLMELEEKAATLHTTQGLVQYSILIKMKGYRGYESLKPYFDLKSKKKEEKLTMYLNKILEAVGELL